MTVCSRNVVSRATTYANNITPSVLAVARLLKVSTGDFAKALRDADANAKYHADITSALVSVFMAEAIEAEKEAE